MHSTIEIRYDQKRGCGWRKAGGLYLVADGLAMPCGRMPIPLTVCPCCSTGIKQSRGWTWINLAAIAKPHTCKTTNRQSCCTCALNDAHLAQMSRVGLLWVGETFYKTPREFVAEAMRLGISRRIAALPKGLEIGKTWVALAHPKAINMLCTSCANSRQRGKVGCDDCEDGVVWTPAIFQLFKPTAVEYVVKGNETDDELKRLVRRGITPVRIENAQRNFDLRNGD